MISAAAVHDLHVRIINARRVTRCREHSEQVRARRRIEDDIRGARAIADRKPRAVGAASSFTSGAEGEVHRRGVWSPEWLLARPSGRGWD